MNEHTATPWGLMAGRGNGPNGASIISRGITIARMSSGADLPIGEKWANARFIVRACNSHEQLLASLIEANEILQAWGDWVNAGDMVEAHAEETGISEDRVAKAFDQIRDAIAAAEGADHV